MNNKIAKAQPNQDLIPLMPVMEFYKRQLNKLFCSKGIGAQGKKRIRGARHLSFGVICSADDMKSIIGLSEEIAFVTRSENVTVKREGGLVTIQFQLWNKLWQTYTGQDVNGFGIGLAEGRQPVDFVITDEAPQTLFAGMTGSGKTEALKAAMVAQCRTHKPNDLKIIIIDPHNELDEFDGLAHLALPIARDEKSINNALVYANQQITHRNQNNIKEDHRLLVVVDETEEVFKTDKQGQIIDPDRKLAIENLVNGRKYKTNVIVTGLEPKVKTIPFLAKLGNRYVGLVADDKKSYSASGVAGLQAHKLTGKGDMYHVGKGIEATRFQAVMITEADYNLLPRAETTMPIVENTSACELPIPDETPRAGRPNLQIEGDLMIRYLMNNNNYSNTTGPQELGISLKHHRMHKCVTIAMFEALKKMNLQLKFEKIEGDKNG